MYNCYDYFYHYYDTAAQVQMYYEGSPCIICKGDRERKRYSMGRLDWSGFIGEGK